MGLACRLVETESPGLETGEPCALRLGEALIERGLLTSDQLDIALHEQTMAPAMLGEILERLSFLDGDALALFLAERAGFQSVDLERIELDPALVGQLPVDAARRSLALPIALRSRKLELAMADPFDIVALDEVRRHFHASISFVPRAAHRAAIEKKIEAFYGAERAIASIVRELGENAVSPDDLSRDHPIVRLVDAVLADAARRGASDVHFEPEAGFVRVRVRLDGLLRQTLAVHLTHWPALSHRLKLMAGMNIAETRGIQDGRFRMRVSGADVDCRVAVMPTVWGETVVVRLLDHRRSLLSLESLGYDKNAFASLEEIAARPQGLTLVTGPTGSGKTTTLYALLKKLASPDVHVATLEDPVEFQLDLIRQTSIKDARNLDFAAGVRGLLRMDPDILLIGEIRDSETAQMALRAAMTGHRVYATVHCNDALGALPRLIDLGLNPRILSGNVSGLVAQRLVRKLCPACKKQRRANEKECALLGCDPVEPPSLAFAQGCPLCEGTGYKGRTVVAEVLPVSCALDDLIAQGAERRALRQAAHEEGFATMRQNGIARALALEVSLDELARVLDLSRKEGA